MNDKEFFNRGFVIHKRNFFTKEALQKIRNYYINSEKLNEAARTDREISAVMRGESSDALRLSEVWYEPWATSNYINMEVFNRYGFILYPPQVRNVRASNHKVPWHQDTGYMKRLGDKAPSQIITCFVPLEEIPSNHTTLEFTDRYSHVELQHTETESFGAGIEIDEDQNKYHYELELGDALIFGDLVAHRTYTPKGCQLNRRSIEFRLIMSDDLRAGKDYFQLNGCKFIRV